MADRIPMDLAAYEERVRSGGCFVCEFLHGEPGSEHELMAESGILAQTPDEVAALGAAIRAAL